MLDQAAFLRQKRNAYVDEKPEDLDHMYLMRQLAEPCQPIEAGQQPPPPHHYIIISHVTHPCSMKFQLARNKPGLDDLMDSLEKLYQGIGSTHYIMPDAFVTTGRLCAGIFPGDNNWHRAEIVQPLPKTRQAEISYIDYGGMCTVSNDQLAFLRRDFGDLPVQAADCKMANVKYHKNKALKDYKVIEYLLAKVCVLRFLNYKHSNH